MASGILLESSSGPNADTLRDLERFLEMWDGELYTPPIANNQHYLIQTKLALAFLEEIDWDAGDCVTTGGNVSDREEGWMQNYRCPDGLVVLRESRAIDRGTHWFGGPDIVVEIISDGEDPYAKRDFYESIGVREFVIVERHPWAVELFQLQSGRLVSVGRSDEANGAILDSAVLPVSYRVVSGSVPQRVEVTNLKTNQAWNLAG